MKILRNKTFSDKKKKVQASDVVKKSAVPVGAMVGAGVGLGVKKSIEDGIVSKARSRAMFKELQDGTVNFFNGKPSYTDKVVEAARREAKQVSRKPAIASGLAAAGLATGATYLVGRSLKKKENKKNPQTKFGTQAVKNGKKILKAKKKVDERIKKDIKRGSSILGL